ncbi:MAG: hypothetical protein PVG54_14325 [Anaerolineae bacterium]|jgi:hypothetical protein
MADRKQTPDILGEILGGDAPAPPPAPAPEPKTPAEPKAARRKKSPGRSTGRRAKTKRERWEYREIVFRNYGGYRPRYVNGEEQPGWKEAPVIHEYLNQLGDEGWELVGVGGQDDREMPAYFRRRKT